MVMAERLDKEQTWEVRNIYAAKGDMEKRYQDDLKKAEDKGKELDPDCKDWHFY